MRHFLLEDFPSDTLAGYGIGARHSDMLLSGQIDATPDNFLAAAKLRLESLKIPPKCIAGYLTTLETMGLTRSVTRLRVLADRP